MTSIPFEDVRVELAEMNRTLQNLHEFQDNFEFISNALDVIQRQSASMAHSLAKLVCVHQRLVALNAVDASLRCPWSEHQKESLVNALRRLTNAAMSEAFDDIESP